MSEYTDYYSDLLILQYKTQPKARGTVGALVSNGPASAYDIGPVKYNIIGSPTIVDGVVSGFSNSNYLSTDSNFLSSFTNFEIVLCAKLTSEATTQGRGSILAFGNGNGANGNISCFFWKSGFLLAGNDTGGGDSTLKITNNFEENSVYFLKVVRDGNKATIYYSTNGVNWLGETVSANFNWQANSVPVNIGRVQNWAAGFRGSIDLNHTYIKVNGKLWFGTLPNPNNLTSLVLNGYDIDTAEGNQLDVLGKYIGLSRNVKEKINSPATVILTDEQYRLLLKLKRVSNISYSSTSQIRRALYEIFPNDIRVFDHRTMRMEYQLSTQFNDLVSVILAEQLLPFPMGLDFDVVVVPDLLQLYGYYGYDGLNDNPNGYSSYTDGFKGKYLSYGDKT